MKYVAQFEKSKGRKLLRDRKIHRIYALNIPLRRIFKKLLIEYAEIPTESFKKENLKREV